MTLKALSKIAPDWYTPDGQKDKPNPTRFKIRPLTPPEYESLLEVEGINFVIRPGRYADVLRMGLVDWENFSDENDQPVSHSIADHARIPGPIRIELATTILIRSRLTPEEKKT